MRFTSFIVSGLVAAAGVANASLVQKRSFVDVCAAVDANLNVLGIVFGKVDVCLCVSALPLYIQTDASAIAAVKIFGSSIVTDALKLLINLAPGKKSCTYPDHSTALCTSSCGFTCKPPYVKSGTTCVLPPSSGTHKRSLPADEATCPWGLTKCGVLNSASSRVGFECLDTQTNLESCGGCTVAFGLTGEHHSNGSDCTAIEGVSDVGCLAGKCQVRRCKSGWALGDDGNSCVELGSGATLLNMSAQRPALSMEEK